MEIMEQNEQCIVLDSGWLLFSDGEMRERGVNKYAMTRKPATEQERSKLQVLYWQKKLALCIEAFDHQKSMLLGDANNRLGQENMGGPCMAEEEAIALLNSLKSKVNYAKEKLDEAEREQEKNTPPSVKKSLDITEQNRQRLGSFIHTISSIEI